MSSTYYVSYSCNICNSQCVYVYVIVTVYNVIVGFNFENCYIYADNWYKYSSIKTISLSVFFMAADMLNVLIVEQLAYIKA